MRSIRTLLVSALLVATTTCTAQGFATPLEGTSIMMSKEVHAILLDGTDLVGTVGSCMLNMGQLQSLTLKDAAGEKRKLKAEELSELRVKPTKMDNIGAMLSQPNLQAMITQDFSKSLDREWCYFVQTSPPGKDKKVMMQLLNPGFDKKMKVFVDPMAQETASGEDKSYFVVKEGSGEAIKVKKGSYSKEALKSIFNDCQVMVDNYAGDKMKLRDFAEHVFVFEQLCQ